MSQSLVIIPQPRSASGFVSLSVTGKGKLYEKHILNFGDLIYPNAPGGKVKIDDAFADTLIANFTAGVCDIVQVPVAGSNNEHTEDPNRNIGRVIGLTKRGKKIYAQIDVRDPDAVPKMGNTFLGASAMLHLNYTDTHSGKKVGPTLLHVVVTNRPYVTGLEEYQEIVAATARADGNDRAVLLTAKEEKMTREELIARLKTEHGVDVEDLETKATLVDSAVALTSAVQGALVDSGVVTLSNDEGLTADQIVQAVKDNAEKIVSLTAEAAKKDAEHHVDELVSSGHILPANRDAQVELLLSNPELFDKLLPAQPLVKLSHESGADPADEKPVDDVEAEIARLTNTTAAKQYIH
jgi:hypothetical protein